MKTLITLIISLITLVNPVQNDPKAERVKILDKMFETLEQNIANPNWLKTDAYHAFKEKLYSEEALSMSEESFLDLFNRERHSLPFTHFQLLRRKNGNTSSSTTEESPVTWRAIDNQTAYMQVRTFSSDASTMVSAVQEIGVDTYDNLIIDLRSNTGGTLDAPVVLGRFLTDKPIDAGIYLTRRWYLEQDHSATPQDIAGFPYLKDFTYAGITKMFNEEAGFRMVIPGHDQPVFTGNVYVLVSNMTASACEPLIDLFKKEDIGTLVGSKSAGAMLSSHKFPLNESFVLTLPVADYLTASGERIDKVGVAPDIEVDPDDALEYVLENLITKSN